MTNLVTMIREYAYENYWHHSWDLVATRWSDAEIAAAIKGAKTRRGAIAKAWGKLQATDAARPACRRPVKPASLFEFLAANGGLRPTPDLTYILDRNPLVPQQGPLLRASGLTLDLAREACVEAGYLADTPWEGGVATSTVNDMLDAIADEARGMKRYPMGQEPIQIPNFDARRHQQEANDACPF